MRFFPKGCGTALSGRMVWRLLVGFVILSITVGQSYANDENATAEMVENTTPEENSWGWSAGGWFSLGGWSSSWRSMVSGTRSMFRWRFGNVTPETDEEGEFEEDQVPKTTTEEGITRRCEELTIEACRGLGYDATSMPNLLNHESQDIAQVELAQFYPLVLVNCSSDMTFFLCALHAPKCSENEGGVNGLLPCRPVCERIKSRCSALMDKFQYEWPSIFECNKYPDQLQSHCTGQ